MTAADLKERMEVVNVKNGRRAKVNWIGKRLTVVGFRYVEGVGQNRFGRPNGTNSRCMDTDKFLAAFEVAS